MFNYGLSCQPDEIESIEIENPPLDQFDLLNEFELLNEKRDSMAVITHESPKPQNLYTIYEVESNAKNLSKSEISEHTSFSNIAWKEENSLSRISEFFFILFDFL